MKTLFTFLAISCLCFSISAQEITITGTVTDAKSGMALVGVNVVEKGTNNGTQTDTKGKYEIIVKVGNTLVFTYPGYRKQEIKATCGTNLINIQMSKSLANPPPLKLQEISDSQMLPPPPAIESMAFSHVQNDVRFSGNSPQIPITETESYDRIEENSFKSVATAPLSTFSIDVDKAGYSNIRRMINKGQKIPKDAVKVEEMINYFQYDYPEPNGEHPFSITTEIAASPWNEHTKLVRIGLKGKQVNVENAPSSNLVFLIDVSGSMSGPNRLPLLQESLKILVDQLREKDQVSIVVYAGAAGLVLEPTPGSEKEKIKAAIDRLRAGGSTAGGAGIKLAYKIAVENFIEDGNNRVVLATDGDFNVGMSSNRSMEELIEEKRESGVFLTCLGVGMGNYRDAKIETLAQKGNGNYYYIDTMQEAKRVLGTEFFGTIYTIAKDVKIQVEFNPKKVQAYRLIGYENRMLEVEDFKNDKKDAGELGSGHTVTAFYELIPTGVESKYLKDIPDLKYTQTKSTGFSEELLTVKFRYKKPEGEKSKLIVKTVIDDDCPIQNASTDFKFAAGVALFGMQLRDSKFISTNDISDIIALAESGRGEDEAGYRAEFIRLVGVYQ